MLKHNSTTRTYSKMCSFPLPVYTGKHIQEWLLLESLPSHSFATLKWTFFHSFSHSFICWSILGFEFKFYFKTLTIPFCLQKELNASNIWLGQELCSHPNFTVFPTQTATQDTRSQHYCFLLTAWLIAWQRNQPKISPCMLNMKIFFFLTWLWKKRMFLCLKVCTTGKSYIVLFFIFQCTFPMLKLLFFWRWDSILFKTLSQIITDLPGIFNSAVTQFFPNFKRLIHSKLLY